MEQAECALKDARLLSSGGGSAQAVLNRAYYAMFYAVLALLQPLGRVPGKHQGAISLFDREFVHKGIFTRQMSVDIHRAFEFRQDADYKTLGEVPIQQAREMLEKAHQFVAVVSRYLPSVDKSPE